MAKPDSTSPENVLELRAGKDRQHRMSLQSDDRSPKAPAARAAADGCARLSSPRWRSCSSAPAIGFVGFLSQLRGAEEKPARNADGIVVLTGGSSRVSDAMELLAARLRQAAA